MPTRYDLMPVVPFDDVKGFDGTVENTRGVIFKAGCQSSAATEAGLGIGRSFTADSVGTAAVGNLSNLQFTNGGVSAIAEDYGWVVQVNSRYQHGLSSQGTLQFDVLLADLLAHTGTTARPLFAFTGASRLTAGPDVKMAYVAPGGGAYRIYTDGSDAANTAFTGAVYLAHTSKFIPTEVFQHVLTNLTATTDGWVTISVSWNNKDSIWFVNGVPISRAHRKAPGAFTGGTQAKVTDIRIFGNYGDSVGRAGITIRNILVLNSPRPDPMRSTTKPRVVILGHSFTDTCEAAANVLPVDSTKAWSARGSSVASDQSLSSAIYKNLGTKCSMWAVGTGGINTTTMLARINNTPFVYPAGDGSNSAISAVHRWRPHFVVIIGPNNDTNAAAVLAGVTAINAALIAKGIVPVWCREQNRNATGANGASSGDQSLKDAALVTQIAADIVTYGDIGLADAYTPTGGATCGAQYAENTSAKIHPSLLAYGTVYGPVIAAEIDRLIATPPAYAWWK